MINCTFGSHEFTLLASPTGADYTRAATYAEHALINNKPRLQFTGLNLTTINLSFYFHSDFCDPTREVAKIQRLMEEHESGMLVMASGEVKGEFVIRDIKEKVSHADAQGRTISMTVTVDMTECVPRRDKGSAPGLLTPSEAVPLRAVNKVLPSLPVDLSWAVSIAESGRELVASVKDFVREVNAEVKDVLHACEQVVALKNEIAAEIGAMVVPLQETAHLLVAVISEVDVEAGRKAAGLLLPPLEKSLAFLNAKLACRKV